MAKLNADCLHLIFDELRTDRNSLYSCLLVNKEWCNIVIPILWKVCPWNSLELYLDIGVSEKDLFNTILSCLPLSSRQLLSDNNIKLPSKILLKPTLFNYISFCEFPDARIIDNIVSIVFKEEINAEKPNSYNILEQEIYKLFVSQCENIKEYRWETLQPLSFFPGALTCFSQLRSLEIDLSFVNSDSLYEMAQICKDLNELNINNCQDLPGLISLIDTQRNLKSVTIYPSRNKKENCKELSKALSRKGNTLNYLCFTVGIIPPSFLTSLVNLKGISIRNNENFEDTREEIKEFQQYLAISEFPELQSLSANWLSCFKELAMLIEKTNGNIFDFEVYAADSTAKNTGMLVKAISNNCPRIKILTTYLEPKDFIHVKLLLLNCRYLERIKFCSFDYSVNENDNIGDELLDILAKFSPKSLTEIDISGDWKCSINAFERFFESCRGRTLFYFDITSRSCNRSYITKEYKMIFSKYIKEGVIKYTNCE